MKVRHISFQFSIVISVLAAVIHLSQPAFALPAVEVPISSISTYPSQSISVTDQPVPDAKSLSVGEIVQWVCKVLITVVAVSAWVYSVVVTEGILLVVARETIKYVTLPTVACGWL
jgi:hypothetical protein